MKSRALTFDRKGLYLGMGILLGLWSLGCASSGQDLERLNQQQAATIHSLNQEIDRLNQELDQVIEDREALAKAKADLEKKLQEELASGDMSVSLEERGLVVTVQDHILFDSGKSELKDTAREALQKIEEILSRRVGGHKVYIEGHTDNEPIRYSGWRSNWELSTGRATEVIHYFVEEGGFNPELLAAVGYGEFHPIADNSTSEGRQANRRVEIVISPKKVSNTTSKQR